MSLFIRTFGMARAHGMILRLMWTAGLLRDWRPCEHGTSGTMPNDALGYGSFGVAPNELKRDVA